MSTLAGWAGEPLPSNVNDTALRRMLASAWQDDADHTDTCLDARAAMAVVRSAKPASVCHDAELQVAVVGNIYWKPRSPLADPPS